MSSDNNISLPAILEKFRANLVLLVEDGQILSSAPSALAIDQNLQRFAGLQARLPKRSWLHTCQLENQANFVLTHQLNQDQRLLLVFPLSTRISTLESTFNTLNQPVQEAESEQPVNTIIELTQHDLKITSQQQAAQGDFLSILKELDQSDPEPALTPANEGDTQPISINS